jgi:hypothetical protein
LKEGTRYFCRTRLARGRSVLSHQCGRYLVDPGEQKFEFFIGVSTFTCVYMIVCRCYLWIQTSLFLFLFLFLSLLLYD